MLVQDEGRPLQKQKYPIQDLSLPNNLAVVHRPQALKTLV